MQVLWSDKDELSKFRLPIKRYKNSKVDHYESDHTVISRMVELILELSQAKEIVKYADRLQKYDEILQKLNKPNGSPLTAYPYGSKLQLTESS